MKPPHGPGVNVLRIKFDGLVVMLDGIQATHVFARAKKVRPAQMGHHVGGPLSGSAHRAGGKYRLHFFHDSLEATGQLAAANVPQPLHGEALLCLDDPRVVRIGGARPFICVPRGSVVAGCLLQGARLEGLRHLTVSFPRFHPSRIAQPGGACEQSRDDKYGGQRARTAQAPVPGGQQSLHFRHDFGGYIAAWLQKGDGAKIFRNRVDGRGFDHDRQHMPGRIRPFVLGEFEFR